MADTARVIGDVRIGENANFWYGVSIRGDVAPVAIGSHTNVQDNAVVHC
ncbi:MAG: gamma carbonic anhydrase family protein, partial [Alphaproteobacteria bacterium]|nr:gamma carbonic anhydrase family protein [Alphaproteobacteria bacterium]